MSASERRTTQRFSMRLPLTVRWTTGAAVGESSTESRDVSSRGVYFFLQKDVKEGSAVEILLTLPNEITLAGPVIWSGGTMTGTGAGPLSDLRQQAACDLPLGLGNYPKVRSRSST